MFAARMKTTLSARGALLAAALLGSAGAVASGSRTAKGFDTGEIAAIGMDGPLVAYDVTNRNSKAKCNVLYAWKVKTRVRKRVSGRGTCEADGTSTGAGVTEIAVAGKRIAWLVNEGGNTESTDYLYRSSWRKPKEKRVAVATRTGEVGDILTGNWMGGLVGSSPLLAVNRWATDQNGDVSSAKLMRVGTGLKKLAGGLDTRTARSTDAGRIAVVRTGGDVGLYSKSGALLHTFNPSSVKDVALTKKTLVVLTAENELEVYKTSGKLVHTWPLKGKGIRRMDANKGIAVYSSKHTTIRAVRLATGKDVVLVKPKKGHRINELLDIEAPGVAYAYNMFSSKTLKFSGHVDFVSMKKVKAAL